MHVIISSKTDEMITLLEVSTLLLNISQNIFYSINQIQ